jgi:hypothetical protein
LLIADIIRHTPGFSGVNVIGLALLWCARPRLAWIAVLLVIQKEKGMYFAVGASTALAEVILQGIGAAYIGMTANFASTHSCYQLHHLDALPEAPQALMMYSGAMLWLATVGLAVLLSAYIFFGIGKILREAFANVVAFLYKQGLVRKFGAVCSNVGKFFRATVNGLRRVTPNMTTKLDRKTTSRVDTINMSTYPSDSEAPSLFSEWWESHRELRTSDGVPTYTPSTIRASSRENLDFREPLVRMGLNSQALKWLIWFAILMAFPFIEQWLFWAGFIGMAKDL